MAAPLKRDVNVRRILSIGKEATVWSHRVKHLSLGTMEGKDLIFPISIISLKGSFLHSEVERNLRVSVPKLNTDICRCVFTCLCTKYLRKDAQETSGTGRAAVGTEKGGAARSCERREVENGGRGTLLVTCKSNSQHLVSPLRTLWTSVGGNMLLATIIKCSKS